MTLSTPDPNLHSPPVSGCRLLGAGPRLGRGAAAGSRVPRQVPARQVRGEISRYLGLSMTYLQHIYTIYRYEEVARAPAATLASLLGRWNISLGLDTDLGPDPEPDTGWSWRRNSVQKVMFELCHISVLYLQYSVSALFCRLTAGRQGSAAGS